MSSISLTVTTLKDQDIWAYVRADLYLNNSNGSYKNPTAGSITIAGTQSGKNPELWESGSSNPQRTFTFSVNVTTSTTFIGSAYYWIKKKEKAKTWGLTCSLDLSGTSSGYLTGSGSVSVSPWTSYTVSYNANGGTGAPKSQVKWHSYTSDRTIDQWPVTISSTVPTKTGYSFSHWYTTKSGTGGTRYNAGDQYNGNEDLTLYAQWNLLSYTVTYNANGGTNAPSNQTKTYGNSVTLAGQPTPPSGQRFAGWSTSPGGQIEYNVGSIYSANANVTLYAIYVSAYQSPKILNTRIIRCDDEGTEALSGEYYTVYFEWMAGIEANGAVNPTTVTVTGGGINYTASFTSATSRGYFSPSNPIAYALGSSESINITVTDTADSENPVAATVSLAIPRGGAVVHFSHNGRAVRFFGIASETDEGVIFQDMKLDVDSADPLAVALTDLGWEDLI